MKHFFLFLFFFVIFFTCGFRIFDSMLSFSKNFPFFYFSKNLKVNLSKNELDKYSGKIVTTIVIGSGPAGCAAALYASRLGGRVLLIKGNLPGGQLIQTGEVENWPGILPLEGKKLMEGLIKQTENSGVKFLNGNVIKIDTENYPYSVTLDSGEIYYTYSIIIASGSSPKKLACKGEDEYWGKGVSSCAICDAPMFLNKDVVVVGGGDSAFEEAMQLSEYAKSIKILIRTDKIRASKIMIDRVKNNPKIEIIFNCSVIEIVGNEEKIEKIIINKNNERETLNINGVFIAIGHTPNNKFFKNLISLNKDGYIVCQNRSQKTNIPGIFAAGDIEENEYKQAGSASGDGIKAGIDSYRFLQDIGITSDFIKKNDEIWFVKDSKNTVETKENFCKDGVCEINFSKNKSLELKNDLIKDEFSFENIDSMEKYKDLISSMEEKNDIYLIKFSTTYCPACRILEKNLKDYFEENKNLKIKVYSMMLDKVPFASEYFEDIMSVPVLFFMKGKNVLYKKTGSIGTSEIDKLIKKYFDL